MNARLMVRPLLLSLVAVAALGAALTRADAQSPTFVPGTVSDAPMFRDSLIQLAMANLEEVDEAGFTGFFDAWKAEYPWLGARGFALPATATQVSLFYSLLNSKDEAGPDNPRVILFTAIDDQQRCAVGAIYGDGDFDSTWSTLLTTGTSSCTASAGVEAFRIAFEAGIETPTATSTATASATPTATSTPTAGPSTATPTPAGSAATATATLPAPAPPSTGTGTSGGSPSGLVWLTAGGLLVAAGGAWATLRKQRSSAR